jgi:hypothetical protein
MFKELILSMFGRKPETPAVVWHTAVPSTERLPPHLRHTGALKRLNKLVAETKPAGKHEGRTVYGLSGTLLQTAREAGFMREDTVTSFHSASPDEGDYLCVAEGDFMVLPKGVRLDS